MTTTLVTFLIALALSLLLTPLAAKFGRWGKAMDCPDGIRKCHKKSTPRTGGIALFFAFILSLVAVALLRDDVPGLVPSLVKYWGVIGAGALVFSVGIWDDYSRLNYRIKFAVQLLAASLVYFNGFGIFKVLGFTLFPVVSYGLTVFWILLFINAVNLLDGLDGLSAGVCLFCSLTMTLYSLSVENWGTACLFACLSGTLVGFLRYNFNPATIFMGDGGSYFLGYAIAVISLSNSLKTHTSAAVLIPIVAMGVPMFDTFLSPVRRFLTGRGPFKPDRGHIHHMLVHRMGLNVRKAVLILYSTTCVLCLTSLVIINVQSPISGIIFVMLAACAFLFIGKLGYLDSFNNERIFKWLQDIGYVAGLSNKRRKFLYLQNNIFRSNSKDELWQNITVAIEWMNFDYAEMKQKTPGGRTVIHQWSSSDFDFGSIANKEHLMKLELPLVDNGGDDHGTLLLVRDTQKKAISQFTFMRIEQLRRTIESRVKSLRHVRQEKKAAKEAAVPSRSKPVWVE